MVVLKYSECKKFVNPLKFVKLRLPAAEVFIYEGERKYLVHEDVCTCLDFLLRKIDKGEPCKHICTVKFKGSIIERNLELEENEVKAMIIRALLRAQ